MSYRTYDDGDDWNKDDFNMFASQGIARFINDAGRSAGIPYPTEGQYADVEGEGLFRWDGSGWVSTAPRVGVSGAMVAGTITISVSSVTDDTLIFLSHATAGGTLGHLSSVRDPGVGFTINSSGATDTSTVNYWLIEGA
jgi:hypothetical protein